MSTKFINRMPNTSIQQISEKNIKLFLDLLKRNKMSDSTLISYKSDIYHFYNWFLKEKSETNIYSDWEDVVSRYKSYMQKLNTSPSSVLRRITTLKKYNSLMLRDEISIKKTELAAEYHYWLERFVKYLKLQKLTSITINNYRSDIKDFLLWLQNRSFSLEEISSALLTVYFTEMKTYKSPKSIQRTSSSLNKFLKIFKPEAIAAVKPNTIYSTYLPTQSLKYLFLSILLLLGVGLIKNNRSAVWISEIEPNMQDSVTVRKMPLVKDINNIDKDTINSVFLSDNSAVSAKAHPAEFDFSAQAESALPVIGSLPDKSIEQGRSKILRGQKQVRVDTSNSNQLSTIIVTPLSSPNGNILYIVRQNMGYFIIGIETPIQNDLDFNWLSINNL